MAETKKTTTRRRKKTEVTVEAEAPVAVEAVEEPKAEAKANAEMDALKEQIELQKQQIEMLKAQISATPQVIQISNDTERVDFLWLAPVADENELLIGGGVYGKITGKVGNFSVPKNELSRVLDAATRDYLESRWLLILGGLTEEERIQYGVDYKAGEVLDKQLFIRLMDLQDEIVDIYKGLCDESRKIVAKMYHEAYIDPAKRPKVKRANVVAMNKIAPQAGLKAIIEAMNAEEVE